MTLVGERADIHAELGNDDLSPIGADPVDACDVRARRAPQALSQRTPASLSQLLFFLCLGMCRRRLLFERFELKRVETSNELEVELLNFLLVRVVLAQRRRQREEM